VPVDAVPLTRLERDWSRERASAQLATRFGSWKELEPALMPFAGPDALLRFLRRRGVGVDKDAVLLALLRRARHEPLAGRVVLEAILPGLKRIAGRMLIDVREREELWSVLLACAWERIRGYPVERRPRRVAANLLLDCMRGTLAALSRARTDRTLTSAELPPDLSAAEPVDGDVDALLARAVRAGAITAPEAELILSTRIDGVPLASVAGSQNIAYNTLKLRRQRAERRLLLYLGHPPVPRGQQNRPSCPARVAGAGLRALPAEMTNRSERRR
jgi:DNA-directed RNA polymerase specialized sigma24 family protein